MDGYITSGLNSMTVQSQAPGKIGKPEEREGCQWGRGGAVSMSVFHRWVWSARCENLWLERAIAAQTFRGSGS